MIFAHEAGGGDSSQDSSHLDQRGDEASRESVEAVGARDGARHGWGTWATFSMASHLLPTRLTIPQDKTCALQALVVNTVVVLLDQKSSNP